METRPLKLTSSEIDQVKHGQTWTKMSKVVSPWDLVQIADNPRTWLSIAGKSCQVTIQIPIFIFSSPAAGSEKDDNY